MLGRASFERAMEWFSAALKRDRLDVRTSEHISVPEVPEWPAEVAQSGSISTGSPQWMLSPAFVGPDTTGIGPSCVPSGAFCCARRKPKPQAGVSVGDLNRDSLPDIVPGNGRHWSLYNRVLLNQWRSIGPIRRRLPEGQKRTLDKTSRRRDAEEERGSRLTNTCHGRPRSFPRSRRVHPYSQAVGGG